MCLFIEVCYFLLYTLYFVRETCIPTQGAWEKSRSFDWPGNWASYYLLPIPPIPTSYFGFWLVTVMPFLAKRLALTCSTAQKPVSIESFWGLLTQIFSSHSSIFLTWLQASPRSFQWHLFLLSYCLWSDIQSSMKLSFMTTGSYSGVLTATVEEW